MAFKRVTLWDVIHRLAKNITFLINVYDNKHYNTKRKYSSIESRLDDFLWEGELDTMKEKYEVESTHKNAKFAIKKVTNMQNFLLKREKLSVEIDSCQGNVRIVLGDKNKLTFNTKEERLKDSSQLELK